MAGIWNRLIPGEDRVPVHFLKAAVDMAAAGTFSDAAILSNINAKLIVPLDAAAQTDLLNLKTQASTGAVGIRALYLINLESVGIAVENGMITSESMFRTKLNIP